MHDITVLPFGGPLGPDHRAPAARNVPASTEGASFAEVIDLAERRERLTAPTIPDEVWDEVEAASRLWHELQDEHKELKFDAHDIDGRVVVSLCDLDGQRLRAVPLRDALEVTPPPEDAA